MMAALVLPPYLRAHDHGSQRESQNRGEPTMHNSHPRPSQNPAPKATTFFMAPHSSAPATSSIWSTCKQLASGEMLTSLTS